jgi:hypothetical protein
MDTRSLNGDHRGRVIGAIEEGFSTHQAARRFRIGISTAGAYIAAISSAARSKRASSDSRRARSMIRTRPPFRASSGDAGHHACKDWRARRAAPSMAWLLIYTES